MLSKALNQISYWFDLVADHANPILVKETRQALKGRQFALTFILLLTASWIISAGFAINAPEEIEYGAIAMDLFYAFYVVLAFAVVIVVPLGAFLSLSGENQENTFDLLSITTLNPTQIVRGKLESTLVQTLVYYSAIAPFMAFTALLNGFDFLCCVFMLAITMVASITGSIFGLMMAAVMRSRRLQSLMGLFWLLIVLGCLVTVYFWLLGGLSVLTRRPLPYGWEFWSVTAICCVGVGSYVVFLVQITASQLTFASDNRTSGIRLTASIQIMLYLMTIAFLTFYVMPPSSGRWTADETFTMTIPILIHLAVIGLFQVTQPNTLTPRTIRDLPTNPFLRFLWIPYLPGGTRGLLWLLVNALSIPLMHMSLLRLVTSSSTAYTSTMIAATAYIVIILGFGSLLGRWLFFKFSAIQPGHVRLTLIILVVACIILPYVPFMLGLNYTSSNFTPLKILNPFATLWAIGSSHSTYGFLVPTLCLIAVLAVAANGPAIVKDIQQVQKAVPAVSDAVATEVDPLQPGQTVPQTSELPQAEKPQ